MRQVLDATIAEAIRVVFHEYVEEHASPKSPRFSAKAQDRVGDMLPANTTLTASNASPPLGQSLRAHAFRRDLLRLLRRILLAVYAMEKIRPRRERGGRGGVELEGFVPDGGDAFEAVA